MASNRSRFSERPADADETSDPSLTPAKTADKTHVLQTFITSALTLADGVGAGGVVTLVARSTDSPVARALVALGGDLSRHGIAVRAIFGRLGTDAVDNDWLVSSPEIRFARDLRLATNPRLGDAHEQLVLGERVCWIGDCLRRDPQRRDAFEQFNPADAVRARTLRLSFDRLWSVSEPVKARMAPGNFAATIAPAGLDTTGASLPGDGTIVDVSLPDHRSAETQNVHWPRADEIPRGVPSDGTRRSENIRNSR